MERSDMDGRVAIARRGQPDGWIKSTTYRPELQIHIPQGGIFPNLIIFPFRQRFLATSLYVALDQQYISQEEFDEIYLLCSQTHSKIGGFIAYLLNSDRKR
jgi:hypothetical protein